MSSGKDIKVVLLGDSGVGKSSILLRFVNNEFSATSEPTLGAAFLSQTLSHHDVAYKFQIWDTAGQEKYKALAPLYYKDSRVAIIVYDITKRGSFEVLKTWNEELQKHGPANIIIAVVGNKQDQIEKEQVKYDEAQQYARELNAIFQYTSAKEGKGITELFEKIAEEIDEREKKAAAAAQTAGTAQGNGNIKIGGKNGNDGKKKKSGACC